MALRPQSNAAPQLPIMNDKFLLHGSPTSEDSQQATVRGAKSPINQQLWFDFRALI